LNAVTRSLSRSQSRESSRSDSKRSSSAPAGALAMLGGGSNSGNDYEAPQWTAFGGGGDDNNKSKGKATKMEEVTTVRSSSGTVSIAITETINTACNSFGVGGNNDNRPSAKAGSFSKFFRSGSHHSLHL
jgi:hypothetical protein